MSTDYMIVPTETPSDASLELLEGSSFVTFYMRNQDDEGSRASKTLTAAELRAAIIRQIEVLSYISEDPDEVLARFNVKYGQTI